MIKFAFMLSFVLLMINSGLLVAHQQGVLDNSFHITVISSDTNASAALGQEGISVSPSSSTSIEAFINKILLFVKQLINLVLYVLFGFYYLLVDIFTPLGLGWIATIISLPLAAIQTITIFYLLGEVKRLLPFQS